ncbi:MAG: HPr family phosphocarrier protein [Selenomonadales bacterium]|nr:HPr family phosphocarrier protein [Selenomonadales bacterium]
MEQFTYKIKDPVGIHARPAGQLVKMVKELSSSVTIAKGDKSVSAVKLIAIMGLGVRTGDTITVTVEGENEKVDSARLKSFLEERL